MDGSEKLCFNKVLSQLSDITDKLSGGGTELWNGIIKNNSGTNYVYILTLSGIQKIECQPDTDTEVEVVPYSCVFYHAQADTINIQAGDNVHIVTTSALFLPAPTEVVPMVLPPFQDGVVYIESNDFTIRIY